MHLPAYSTLLALSAVIVSIGANGADGRGRQSGPSCKTVRAEMVEDRSVVGCKPGHDFCFLGEVDGNRGFHGTTYFKGETGAPGPATSPAFRSYTGLFEYTTDDGTLVMRETGVVNVVAGTPQSGAITAFQAPRAGTGEFEGVTGSLFVSAFNRDNHIETIVNGELCWPE
jgi:hypothetical protein